MFELLKSEINKKQITMKAYSQFLGVTEKTLQNKMNGVTDFSLSEIEKTSKYLLPEIKVEKLFFDQQDEEIT